MRARLPPRAPRLPERRRTAGVIPVSRRFRLTAPNLRAGLRYDDIKIEQNPAVVKALERIPADELVNRCVAAARASFSESVPPHLTFGFAIQQPPAQARVRH